MVRLAFVVTIFDLKYEINELSVTLHCSMADVAGETIEILVSFILCLSAIHHRVMNGQRSGRTFHQQILHILVELIVIKVFYGLVSLV